MITIQENYFYERRYHFLSLTNLEVPVDHACFELRASTFQVLESKALATMPGEKQSSIQ